MLSSPHSRWEVEIIVSYTFNINSDSFSSGFSLTADVVVTERGRGRQADGRESSSSVTIISTSRNL